ncbi:Uu.00g111850.m01.CDS01 [Anthostomella pinea]|uniref:Uu.00g111850.m01.CDS01 n=1 Tax=Anthostomella pinea TaxID=933095 RepID=A0AAI8VF86_9PEZI|nr:Uu.00g111850.m01.CDS01 [Anthostomella pinea]
MMNFAAAGTAAASRRDRYNTKRKAAQYEALNLSFKSIARLSDNEKAKMNLLDNAFITILGKLLGQEQNPAAALECHLKHDEERPTTHGRRT